MEGFAGVGINPLPLQQPHPPLWFGGGAAASLRRAVASGAGWIGAGRHSSAEFVELASRLRELLEARPSGLGGFGIAKRVYMLVTDDEIAGAAATSAWFDRFYGRPELGAAVTVMGSAARCADELGTLIGAGANHLLLHPLSETIEQYDRVTQDVVGQLLD